MSRITNTRTARNEAIKRNTAIRNGCTSSDYTAYATREAEQRLKSLLLNAKHARPLEVHTLDSIHHMLATSLEANRNGAAYENGDAILAACEIADIEYMTRCRPTYRVGALGEMAA